MAIGRHHPEWKQRSCWRAGRPESPARMTRTGRSTRVESPYQEGQHRAALVMLGDMECCCALRTEQRYHSEGSRRKLGPEAK